MFLKYFYDKQLAHASYLVACQKSGDAIVIDPGRDIRPYVESAEAEGFQVVGAAETHIHADFVSGSRELAAGHGVKLYLSDEGPADWKYEFANRNDTVLLKDGDEFFIGNLKFKTMHTPGHTPESISFLLTDVGGGADLPMGIFTGDFVFVGSIGRPDLLETAAGVVGSAEIGARQLYHSVLRFRALPDHMQVWPAHGAGSACGKGLGAVPSTTVGYEKLFNPALQYQDEQSFVEYILADQPETPYYFGVMKRVNKAGPALIDSLPKVAKLLPSQLTAIAASSLVIDDAAPSEFGQAHVPKTINLPPSSLVKWAGFLADYDSDLYLIVKPEHLEDRLRSLHSIGIDRVAGYFDAGEVKQSGLRTESYPSHDARSLRDDIEADRVELIDVRSTAEFNQQRIARAQHIFLGELGRRISEIDRKRIVVVQCEAGGRSTIAASILQRAGFKVINLQGGIDAWNKAGLPLEAPQLQPTASSEPLSVE